MWIKVTDPATCWDSPNCAGITMSEFAVLDKTDRKTCRSAIRTGKLVVNLDTRIVSVDDRAVHLSDKEYGLLELLSQHKARS